MSVGHTKMLQTFWLLVTITSVAALTSQSQKHHKVRHKHNLRFQRVNEIREAFDQYRTVLHKNKLKEFPQIEDVNLSEDFDDVVDNNLKINSWETAKATELLKHKHSSPRNPSYHYYTTHHKHHPITAGPSSDFFLRHKKVYTTTTQRTTTPVKSIDNYDEEYEDNDNDTTNRRLNDDAQAGSLRFSRDVS